MKYVKTIAISLICLIFISTIVSMSIATEPKTLEADEEPNIEPCEESKGEISVQGTAQIEIPPDLMSIYLKIMTKDLESAKVAKDQAAKIIDDVLKALKQQGISEDDIETTNFEIEPKYEWEDDEFGHSKKVFKGYFVTVTMKVTLKDFDKAGSTIDAAVDSGALVDSINFELSYAKRNELKTQVLADAAKDAKLKAEAVVGALGNELRDVKSINVNDYQYQSKVYWKNQYLSLEDNGLRSAPPTQILPGDLTISGNVNIVFEIL